MVWERSPPESCIRMMLPLRSGLGWFSAVNTRRIRLGTGVLVPSNRIAAVTANAFATLNGMAPGRIDFGVGTGFSARRAMGLGAMKLAEMEEYIRVVYGLLNGDTVETTIEGKQRKIRFLNPDANLINTRDHRHRHIVHEPILLLSRGGTCE